MRRALLTNIERARFDVIIIGAGINGAGIAHDAARRGLRVLLLDKGDVAGGTTSWSTRLIHGGLRYLEHGEVGLVRESLRERERLLHNAPHLVRPLPLLIPLYAAAARRPLTIRAGLFAYDLLAWDKSLAPHRSLTRAEALAHTPGLAAPGLRGAALYYDAQVEYAERLALENVLAAQAHGAAVLTYARGTRVLTAAGAVQGVEFTDVLAAGRYRAHAPVVVNAAGPWVDALTRDTTQTAAPLIGGTKGSHIVVAPFATAPRVALYAEARADRRPFFIVPWQGLYLIGTTDTRYAGDLDHVAAAEPEIAYLLAETNRVLPQAQLTRAAVLYTYAGVRPLAYAAAGTPGGITRRHFVHDHAPQLSGCLSIVGGKLTTYRQLAEAAVTAVYQKLRRPAPPCSTARLRLPGADCADFARFAVDFSAACTLPAATCARLLRIYGTRAAAVLQLLATDATLAVPFSPVSGALGAEVVFAFRAELAETLTDCLLRRTMVGLNAAAGLDAVAAAAQVARTHLGWDAARAAREVAAYRAYVARFHPRAAAAPAPA